MKPRTPLRPVMRTLYLLAALAIIADGLGARQGPQARKEGSAAARVIPLVGFGPTSGMEVALVFENTSGDVLRYLFHSNDLPFAYIDFILTRNGEVQKPIRHRGRGELSKEWVRELRPGGELMLHLRLQDVYGNLEPGLYALDVRVEGQPRDFGLTQFTLDQRVAYLQIDEVRDEQHRRKP